MRILSYINDQLDHINDQLDHIITKSSGLLAEIERKINQEKELQNSLCVLEYILQNPGDVNITTNMNQITSHMKTIKTKLHMLGVDHDKMGIKLTTDPKIFNGNADQQAICLLYLRVRRCADHIVHKIDLCLSHTTHTSDLLNDICTTMYKQRLQAEAADYGGRYMWSVLNIYRAMFGWASTVARMPAYMLQARINN